MVILLRAFARLFAFGLLAALAVAGLAVAVFSLGGSGDLSLPGLADLIALPDLEAEAGELLGAVEADGPIALRSGLAGLAAVALGVLLLIGALAPARERTLKLGENDKGRLEARRRAFGQVASALVEQQRGVNASRVRVRPHRTGQGGRIVLRARHPASADSVEVERQATSALTPLIQPFDLKSRVRARPDSGRRVQ